MNLETQDNPHLARGQELVEEFLQHFEDDQDYRALTCHAALPLVLTPELLKFLRHEFLPHLSWVAEVDLLLSRLCAEAAEDLYVMRRDARAYLIGQMRQDPSLGETRIEAVNRLLIDRLDYLTRNHPALLPQEWETQRLSAMLYVTDQRDRAARELSESIYQCLTGAGAGKMANAPNMKKELARLTRLVREAADTLKEKEYEELVRLAQLTGKVLSDRSGHYAQQLRSTGELTQTFRLPGITVQLSAELLLERISAPNDKQKTFLAELQEPGRKTEDETPSTTPERERIQEPPDDLPPLPANNAVPVKLFISYAHRDEDSRLELNAHLSNLRHQQIISGWHDRRIAPGQEWAEQIDDALNEAQIILLLISARFIASDYCYAKEMVRAIERHDAGEAVVIPIILSACDWQGAPFSKLQALPKDARPIKSWNNRDEAWADVAKAIRLAIGRLSYPPITVTSPPSLGSSARVFHRLGRKRQVDQFEYGLDQHALSRPNRPLVYLVHGDESECHDLMVDRLKYDILPELLHDSLIECIWVDPPNPEDGVDKFWLSLGRRFLNKRFNTAAESQEQILKELDRLRPPLLVQLQWYSEQFGSARTNGLANFMRFWESWPALPKNCMVICALSLVYSDTKDWLSRLTFSRKSPTDRLKGLVKEYEKGIQPTPSFSLSVLPELEPIDYREVTRWCDDLDRERREEVKDQVIDFFQSRNNRPIDMRTLVKKLREFLDKTDPRKYI